MSVCMFRIQIICKGPVDLVIKAGDLIIIVTETKRRILTGGVTNN